MKKLLTISVVLILLFTMAFSAAAEKTKEEMIDEYYYGGTLILCRNNMPEGIFTPLYSETVYDADIEDLVFEGLTTTNKSFEPVPALAAKWELSEDSKTYTFYLNKNAKFHDGEAVTAEDVKYTFEMFLHPDYTGVRQSDFTEILGAEAYTNGEADTVKGIEIVDDYKLKITLKSIYAPFLAVTCGYGIMPEHILGQYEPAELHNIDFNQHPVGSGPFKFVEYQTDEYAKLAAFEDYHGGRPYLDNVVFRYVDDQSELMMLEKGEIDWADIHGENFETVKGYNNVTLHKQIRNGFGYLAFNLKGKSPVADKAVRQAIAHGTNRKGFQDVVMNGLAVNVNSPISQASWAYTDNLNPYDYEPDTAQKILEDAGWSKNSNGVYEKDGQTLSFTITASSGSDFIDQLVAIVQDNLNKIGFDVKIEKIEFNTLREKIDNSELDVWFMGWRFGADPDPYSVWHSEGDWNRTGFSNERADELMEKALKTLDKNERKNYYVEFQKIWNKSMPYLPMYANIYLHAVNKRVRGFDPNPGVKNPFLQWDLVKNVWIPKDMRRN